MATQRPKWLSTLAALGLFAPTVSGLEPPHIAWNTDRELTHRVQTVLGADAVLRSRSLLVSVVDGVAVVGGPVKSQAENLRLKQLLAIVPGLVDTRLSTWVPVVIPASVAANNTRPSGRIVAQRAVPVPPRFHGLMEPTPLRASTPVVSRGSSAYSPVPPPAPPAPNGPPEYPTIPAPSVPVAPVQNVASAIEELRQSESQYSDLNIRVKSGTVTIECPAHDSERAWDFTELVRKVPGVDRVIVSTTKNR